jgi:hypothetical protein
MPLPEILSSAPDRPSTQCTPDRPSRVIFSRVARTAPTPTASCFHQGLSVSAVYSAVIDPALFSSIIVRVQQMTCALIHLRSVGFGDIVGCLVRVVNFCQRAAMTHCPSIYTTFSFRSRNLRSGGFCVAKLYLTRFKRRQAPR